MPSANEDWESFVSDFLEGRKSVLEFMRETRPVEKDYYGYIMHYRVWGMLMRDRRVLVLLYKEMNEELQKFEGELLVKAQQNRVEKDTDRLFGLLVDRQQKLYSGQPSLLTGTTFEECLAQYLSLMNYVEGVFDEACHAYRRGRFGLALFLSILVIEEVGKLTGMFLDLLNYEQPKKKSGDIGRKHQEKHFIGVMAGALVNSRLDRVLGIDFVKQVMVSAETGKIEQIRQSGLYIDFVGGKVATPDERTNPEEAKKYLVLAGELWAEVLGHFPWEFQRMIQKVIDFEIEIGFEAAVVQRS